MRRKALVLLAMTLILATSAWAASEKILYNFNAFSGDGYYPTLGWLPTPREISTARPRPAAPDMAQPLS